LCGGDAIGVESVRDRGQAVAGCSLAPDPLDRVRGHARRPAEPDALRACARERQSRPLRDQAPLALGAGGEQVRGLLPGGRRRFEAAVERDERPALLLSARQ